MYLWALIKEYVGVRLIYQLKSHLIARALRGLSE